MSTAATLDAPSPHTTYAVLTVCHRGDQEFYELGRVPLEVDAAVLLAAIPHQPPHDCDTADVCVLLDLYSTADPDQGILDDREISAAAANALLDGQFAPRLQQARADLARHYAAQRGRRRSS